MDIRKAFPSKYVKASDLNGKQVRLTILGIKFERMQQGDDQTKPVLYFDGTDKGFVLNKTNGDRIAAVYGWETDSWRGKQIILYPTEVDFQGKSVEAIRVKLPAAQAPPLGAKPPEPTPAPAFGEEEPSDPGVTLDDDEVPF